MFVIREEAITEQVQEMTETKLTLIKRELGGGKIEYLLEQRTEDDGGQTEEQVSVSRPSAIEAVEHVLEEWDRLELEKVERMRREHDLKLQAVENKKKALEQAKRKLDKEMEELELEEKKVKMQEQELLATTPSSSSSQWLVKKAKMSDSNSKSEFLTPPMAALSDFGLFCRDERLKLDGDGEQEAKVTYGLVSGELEMLWEKADPGIKKHYKMLAEQDKQRFRMEWEEYRKHVAEKGMGKIM